MKYTSMYENNCSEMLYAVLDYVKEEHGSLLCYIVRRA